MKLTELLTSPWAIVPESLREIQQIYTTHLKGDKIDLAGVEARLGRPLANEPQPYTVREGGVAVLAVDGVIAPKANLFTQVSGGTSAQQLIRQLQTAGADSRVKALVQVIDSPGGSVFGTPEWAAAVSQLAAAKPVVSVSEASMFSAAYWGGSAANAIYLSGPTVQAGSIGVYSRLGLSQADPTAIEFVRGKYKRGGINGQPPSADYLAQYEAGLDHLYSVFVDTVAQNRGVSADQVLELMADGRVFIGQQALDAGLADGFATVDSIVEQLATNPAQFAARRKAVFALGAPSPQPAGVPVVGAIDEPVPLVTPATTATANPPQEDPMPITREQIAAEAPTLLATLLAEGAQAERDRIQAVRAQCLPGHEALIEGLIADGKSGPGDAAMAINAAERKQREAHAAASAQDAPKPVPLVPTPPTAQAPASAPPPAPAAGGDVEATAKAAWDKDAALRAEFGGEYGSYLAYAKAAAGGQIRTLKSSKE